MDKNGFLLAVMVTVAHIHDSQAVISLMRVLQDAFAVLNAFWQTEVTEEI